MELFVLMQKLLRTPVLFDIAPDPISETVSSGGIFAIVAVVLVALFGIFKIFRKK